MKALELRRRIHLNNILFTTDFSPAADVALPYAAELARHFGAKLYASYVRNPDDYVIVFPEGGSVPPGYTVEQARKKLEHLLDALADIERKAVIEEGQVWPTLASIIEKNEIDLIVIGTRGRTGIKKLLLGSQAEEIFRRAPCPVLTVGPHSSAHLPHTGTISEILYATDFSSESMAAAPYAISLAQEYQAHVTLLHVIVVPERDDLVSSERLLRDLVPSEIELWCEPRFVVEQGPVAETILDVADLRKADLIILSVRRPGGIPGAATHLPIATAHKVVSHANCPVLTVCA
jgi:nucleotide-binding universal stress UspA family protein